MIQWKLVSDGNESEPFDSREAAENEMADLEALGATVELQEVGTEDDSDGDRDAVDAEVIEMSGCGGNTDTDDDLDSLPEPRPEIRGYRRTVSFCPCCDRFSFEIYRCQFNDCGKDLTNEPNFRGDLL